MRIVCARLGRLLCGTAVALIIAVPASAQADPTGHWEGALKTDGREIGLTLDLAKNAKSEWIASMGLPSQNLTGLVVTDVVVDGASVKFVGVELMMAKFDLTVAQDGSMRGTVSHPRNSVPIEFKRTGRAKVELIPASPAVSKELEGDWEGVLETPGRPFRIVLHFRNQADNTVAATIDTPDTGGFALPLNDVRQSDRKVEVGIRIAHARFAGALNADGTELAGKFTHDETGFPLTLRKK